MKNEIQRKDSFKHPMGNYDEHYGALHTTTAPAYWDKIRGKVMKHYGSFTSDADLHSLGSQKELNAELVLKEAKRNQIPSSTFSGFSQNFYG